MNKLFSARFLIAVTVTLVACIGFILKMIPGEEFAKVWTFIVMFYFLKERKPNA